MNGAEVQVVYSIPLKSFLSGQEPWYNGSIESVWVDRPYMYHEFSAMRDPKYGLSEWIFEDPNSAIAESYESNQITGLTAHIALDCARIAYGRDPAEFPYLPDIGYDEPSQNFLNSGGFLRKKI
jgi:hypothetical protein